MADQQKGTVPCPVKRCDETAALFTMRPRSDDESRRRRAGQFYCKCPVHGTLGLNGSQAMRDYFAEHATIWGPGEKPAAREAANDQPKAPPQASSGNRSAQSPNDQPKVPPPSVANVQETEKKASRGFLASLTDW